MNINPFRLRFFLVGLLDLFQSARKRNSSCACCLWLARGAQNLLFSWEMASRDPPRSIAILSESLREDPHGAELWSGVLNAATNTVLARENDLKADLSDADKFLIASRGPLNSISFLMLVADNMLPLSLDAIARWPGNG